MVLISVSCSPQPDTIRKTTDTRLLVFINLCSSFVGWSLVCVQTWVRPVVYHSGEMEAVRFTPSHSAPMKRHVTVSAVTAKSVISDVCFTRLFYWLFM